MTAKSGLCDVCGAPTYGLYFRTHGVCNNCISWSFAPYLKPYFSGRPALVMYHEPREREVQHWARRTMALVLAGMF